MSASLMFSPPSWAWAILSAAEGQCGDPRDRQPNLPPHLTRGLDSGEGGNGPRKRSAGGQGIAGDRSQAHGSIDWRRWPGLIGDSRPSQRCAGGRLRHAFGVGVPRQLRKQRGVVGQRDCGTKSRIRDFSAPSEDHGNPVEQPARRTGLRSSPWAQRGTECVPFFSSFVTPRAEESGQ